LKIDHNPFAKGFRDSGAGKREKKRHPSCLSSLNGGDGCLRSRDSAGSTNRNGFGAVDGNDSDTSEDYEGAPAAKRPKSSASSVNTSAGNDGETSPPLSQNSVPSSTPKHEASSGNRNSV
jgi:T-box protein 2